MKQLQDFLILMSDFRPFKNKLLNKISGNSTRWIIREICSVILPFYFKVIPGVRSYRRAQRNGKISEAVVSFTSFPGRISVVWLVIECLLRQSLVPKKIVLYLSSQQFPNIDVLPKELKQYPDDIVEIHLVNGDIKSHKKYWYAVNDFKDNPLILVDDDLIYDSSFIEDMERIVLKHNNVVGCCWGAQMSWNAKGEILPYSQWSGEYPSIGKITENFFFGSGGGTYFPIGSLDGAAQPINEIMQVCPNADDIWLNAVVRKNGYKLALMRHRISVPEWKIRNNIKLHSINNGMYQNDIQLIKVKEYFIEKFGINPFDKI